jgi:hypothetical protein
MTATATQIVRPDHHQAKPPSVMERLADIPEEEIWLAKQKSARTRPAYRLDVRHFMATLGITTTDELRQVNHRAVITWERSLPVETLLVLGQRDGFVADRGRHLLRRAAAQADVATICAGYRSVLLKPFPYGGCHSFCWPPPRRTHSASPATTSIAYWRRDEVAAVLSVNSSSVYEVPCFGKKSRTLAPYTPVDARDGARLQRPRGDAGEAACDPVTTCPAGKVLDPHEKIPSCRPNELIWF